MPHCDKFGEWQLAEAIAEVAVVDQELWSERVNAHAIQSNEQLLELRAALPIEECSVWKVAERHADVAGPRWSQFRGLWAFFDRWRD